MIYQLSSLNAELDIKSILNLFYGRQRNLAAILLKKKRSTWCERFFIKSFVC